MKQVKLLLSVCFMAGFIAAEPVNLLAVKGHRTLGYAVAPVSPKIRPTKPIKRPRGHPPLPAPKLDGTSRDAAI